MAKALRNSVMDRLLTQDEAATILGITLYKLKAMRWKRIGPPFIKIGKDVRYDLEALKDYLDERTIETKNDLAI